MGSAKTRINLLKHNTSVPKITLRLDPMAGNTYNY